MPGGVGQGLGTRWVVGEGLVLTPSLLSCGASAEGTLPPGPAPPALPPPP